MVAPADDDRARMELNARLQSVLQSVAIEPQHRECLTLTESQENKRYEITGIRRPLVVTAIRMNRLRHLARLKDGSWNKICDYLLITARDGTFCAVFVELKEALRENDDAREQLRRSLPILEYLRSVGAVEDLIKPEVSVRYVILASRDAKRLDKPRIRITPSYAIREEHYRGIDVKSFVCERVSIGSMTK